MKKKSPGQEIEECAEGIVSSLQRWKYINENGCDDPAWQDGMNMNLVRNHILYYKRKISEICEENKISFPEELYLPSPPKVNNSYMANLKQEERVERIISLGGRVTTGKAIFDERQLSLF